jgi:hypothetical protein
MRTVVIYSLVFLSSHAGAQALNQFKPATTAGQREFIRAGVSACLQKIKQRTQAAKVNVFGPCANEKGDWAGLSRSDGLTLTFSVNDDKNLTAGGFWSTVLGREVIVSCRYQVGMITGFEDRKSGMGDLIALNGLCMPAGTDASER